MCELRWLFLIAAAGCGVSENPVSTECASKELPLPRELSAGDLPDALFDEDADSFPIVSVEITQAEWDAFCDNGYAAAQAFSVPEDYVHVWARAKFTLAGETLDDVGVRFMGRGTVQNVFCPHGDGGRSCDSAWRERCKAALADDSERYEDGVGQFLIKPSFKFDFDELSSGRDFHGVDRLNLAGDTGWQTLLDEWLPNLLYGRAGIGHVRTGHAALCINGTYRGLYMIQEQSDQQSWLDEHQGGLEPAGDGAFFKIDGFGPQTYISDSFADYVTVDDNDVARSLYEPRAGTTDADGAELVSLFKELSYDTRGDESAFVAAAETRLDVDQWLTQMAMENALGDSDAMYSNRNNYMLVKRVDNRWEPARFDPDQGSYWWLYEDEVWHDWPGDSTLRGPSLMCLRFISSRAMPNCTDGGAPDDPDNSGFNVPNVRHPVIGARLLHAYSDPARDDYLDIVEELLAPGGVLDIDDVLDLIDQRAALIEPWVGNEKTPRIDPWGPDYYSWRFNVFGGDDATIADCRENPEDFQIQCKYRQMVEFYLDEAPKMLEGIRAGTMPRECPRDEPENIGYDLPLDEYPCP